MSEDKIAEIRERYAGYSLNSGNAGKANEDRGWLLAEVEKLRETVQWYGDRARALSGADNKYPFSDLFEDAGARARKALEGGR